MLPTVNVYMPHCCIVQAMDENRVWQSGFLYVRISLIVFGIIPSIMGNRNAQIMNGEYT
mgnify:FL=1